MKTLVRAFWSGLTSTTRGTWFGILGVCILELCACAFFFQPRRMARMNPGWVIQKPGDEYGLLSFRLMKLRYAKLDGLHVAYMGGSSATRALVAHDDAILSAGLTRALGFPAHFHKLSTNNQRFEDELQIVDQLPPTFKGAVVIGVHDMRTDQGPRDRKRNPQDPRRFALPNSPSVLPFWEERGLHYRRTGIFFVDHLDFFAARRTAALRVGPIDSNWAEWGGRRRGKKYEDDMAKYDKVEEQLEAGETPGMVARRSRGFARSRRVLMKLAANLKKRNIALVLLDTPRFPRRAELLPERLARFRRDEDAFCKKTGAVHWDFNDELNLKVTDFQDQVHVGNRLKRQLFSELLMSHLAELLQERRVSQSSGAIEKKGDAAPNPTETGEEPPP